MNQMLVPIGDKILVKPLPRREEKLDSNIIVAASANAELSEAEVISVSDQLKDIYKKGDIVLYPSGKGVGQLIGREPHLWLVAGLHAGCEVWGIVLPKISND